MNRNNADHNRYGSTYDMTGNSIGDMSGLLPSVNRLKNNENNVSAPSSKMEIIFKQTPIFSKFSATPSQANHIPIPSSIYTTRNETYKRRKVKLPSLNLASGFRAGKSFI